MADLDDFGDFGVGDFAEYPEAESPGTDTPGPGTPEPPPPPSPPYDQGMHRPPDGDLPDPDEIPPHYDWLMVSILVDAYSGTEVDESMASRLKEIMDGTFGPIDSGYGSEIHDVFGRWLTCFTLTQEEIDWVLSQPFVFPDNIELPDSMQRRLNSGEDITIGELFNVLRI